MPIADKDLAELPDSATAVDAHRREQAAQAVWNRILRQVDVDSAAELAAALPHRPGETGALMFDKKREHARALDRATKLAALAGVDDAELPWAEWAVELRLRLARAEETWVTTTDELEHADDYGVDPRAAEWSSAQAAATVAATKAALAEAEKQVAGAAGAAKKKGAGE